MEFDSVIFSSDLFKSMDEYYRTQATIIKDICSLFAIKIRVNKFLPLDSALFVSSDGNVVGIYCDGKLVELPLDSAINYLAKSPLAIKKKPLLDKSDE